MSSLSTPPAMETAFPIPFTIEFSDQTKTQSTTPVAAERMMAASAQQPQSLNDRVVNGRPRHTLTVFVDDGTLMSMKIPGDGISFTDRDVISCQVGGQEVRSIPCTDLFVCLIAAEADDDAQVKNICFEAKRGPVDSSFSVTFRVQNMKLRPGSERRSTVLVRESKEPLDEELLKKLQTT